MEFEERIPREQDPEVNARRLDPNGSKIDTPNDVFHCLVTYCAQQAWRGHQLIKNQFDLRRYFDLIVAQKFEAIVETGCQAGGSCLFFMDTLEALGLRDTVYVGVDIPGDFSEEVMGYAHPHVLIRRDCLAPETLATVREALGGRRKILVVLDSVHSEIHVTEELRLYAPLCGPGSYLVAEDSDHGRRPVFPHYGPCTWEAVDKFIVSPAGKNWLRDYDIEKRYPMTNSPDCWLRSAREAK